MKHQSNGKLFWKTNLYLFQPNIAIYWLGLTFLSALIVIRHFNKGERSFIDTFLLGLKGGFFIIFYYKIFDCMASILEQKETSSFQPTHKSMFPISIRYCLTIFSLTSLGVYLLPNSLIFIFFLCLFFISPAMLITVLLKRSVIEMLKPINWRTAINFVGKSKYLTILYMPFLVTIFSVTGGLVLLTAAGGAEISNQQMAFFTLLLQACLTPYLIALQMIYCAFMMQQPTISEQKRQEEQKIVMPESRNIQRENVQTITINIDPTHSSSYMVMGEHFPLDPTTLKWLKKKLAKENFYSQIQPQIIEGIKKKFDTLSLKSLFLLIEIATRYEDFSLVLFLTQDFKKRFAGRLNIVKVGFYAAQAMDKTGDRKGSIALLKFLLEEFNWFYPGMNQVKRAYKILTEQTL